MATITNSGRVSSGYGASPRTCTIPFTPTTGRALIVIGYEFPATAVISDAQWHTWVEEQAYSTTVRMWRCASIGATPPTGVIFTWEGAPENTTLFCAFLEVSGLSTGARVDRFNQSTSFGTSHVVSVTTAAADNFVVAYAWTDFARAVTAGTGGLGTVFSTSVVDNLVLAAGEQTGAPTTANVGFTLDGSNGYSGGISAVVFAAESAPAGPTINTQPTNQTVTAPATATFTVAATASGGSLSYQWQVNAGTWANVSTGSGGTTASYTTPATTVGMDGYLYRCNVTDSNGTTATSAATLTVNAPVGPVHPFTSVSIGI